ncbi:NAD-dependent epimerase/dehydratase family protein [Alkalisalibacterium limincola]|uniref:UDP-glucose 4-epimerase n=1 Tax=Alkalisalibacterium limincola TaxID=2699169 RepID=A0A5C8KJH2_9GAMM|nr:NAD-dependent epimerase/dehydratase family protein [Alkalisalibacterium limincola]TXK59867.1 NAD-dependent epimerase/dehydratase family protein [Alkalisalibacterium limincola]
MRVLITGGGGFLGRAILGELLAAGIPVVVLDLPGRLEGLPDCGRTEFDFSASPLDLVRHARAGDRLLHLGCTSHPAASMADPAGDVAANVVSSIRLFQAAVQSGVERVVFASSGGTVYGRIDEIPVEESHSTQPLSAYGISKLSIEHYLDLFPTLQGISLRVANPYGRGQLIGTPVGAIAHFVQCSLRQVPVEIWGDGTVVRDYIAVEDVAAAFRLAVTRTDLAPGPYNIGTGRGTSLNEVVDLLSAITGRPLDVRHTQARNYDVPEIVLDSTRFSRATGWKPAVALEGGVRQLWEAALEEAG